MKTEFSRKVRRRRIRLIVAFISIIIAFLIQTSVLPLIPFLSASPNLLIVLTFSIGFMNGSVTGMLYGFFAGILLDMFYSGAFGFYALIYLIIGYASGYYQRFYYVDFLTLPIVMSIVSELLYHTYIYVFRFLVRGKLDILYYVRRIVLPSVIFSVLVTLLLYRFFFSADERLREGNI